MEIVPGKTVAPCHLNGDCILGIGCAAVVLLLEYPLAGDIQPAKPMRSARLDVKVVSARIYVREAVFATIVRHGAPVRCQNRLSEIAPWSKNRHICIAHRFAIGIVHVPGNRCWMEKAQSEPAARFSIPERNDIAQFAKLVCAISRRTLVHLCGADIVFASGKSFEFEAARTVSTRGCPTARSAFESQCDNCFTNWISALAVYDQAGNGTCSSHLGDGGSKENATAKSHRTWSFESHVSSNNRLTDGNPTYRTSVEIRIGGPGR